MVTFDFDGLLQDIRTRERERLYDSSDTWDEIHLLEEEKTTLLFFIDAQQDALAKERERFTMHTAQVHAWLSATLQELGIAKAGQTVDVATVCTFIMDHCKANSKMKRKLKALQRQLEQIADSISPVQHVYPADAMLDMLAGIKRLMKEVP